MWPFLVINGSERSAEIRKIIIEEEEEEEEKRSTETTINQKSPLSSKYGYVKSAGIERRIVRENIERNKWNRNHKKWRKLLNRSLASKEEILHLHRKMKKCWRRKSSKNEEEEIPHRKSKRTLAGNDILQWRNEGTMKKISTAAAEMKKSILEEIEEEIFTWSEMKIIEEEKCSRRSYGPHSEKCWKYRPRRPRKAKRNEIEGYEIYIKEERRRNRRRKKSASKWEEEEKSALHRLIIGYLRLWRNQKK